MATVSTFSGTSAGDIDSLSAVPSATIGSISGITFPNFEGLLDTYTGAAAGYSVRRLAIATTTLLRVRRDTGGAGDGDEANVAYDSNNELSLDSPITPDTGSSTTLGQFLNVGTVNGTTYTNADSLTVTASAYVTEWTDQSGNANDAAQATQALQPAIHDGTVDTDLILENGKPALDFDGVSDKLLSPDLGLLSTDFCIAATCKISASQESLYSLGYVYPTNGMIYRTQASTTNTIMFFDGPSETSVSTTLNASSQTLHFLNFNGGSFDVYGNGANKASATSVYALGDNILHIGVNSHTGGYRLSGTLQEFIIYDVEQSTNRTGIETNINTEFSIY